MEIKIKKLSPLAITPTHGSEYAAGWDVYAAIPNSFSIEPHTTVQIPLDFSLELPEGTFAAIFGRSGLATKQSLRPANCVGICDADYRGNYIVPVHNDSNVVRTVTPGERIAQIIIMNYNDISFTETNELSETDRGSGGFGSTGI